jgi:hypothetical protein
MKLSGKPTFSKPGMVVKKKFEMQDAGPTDHDLKVMAEIERAEKERQELNEEASKKIIAKPQMPARSNRPFAENSSSVLLRPDLGTQSMASLQKVQEGFIAPVKLKLATKQDLLAKKQNPDEPRKF